MERTRQIFWSAVIAVVALGSFVAGSDVTADDAQVQGLTYNQRITVTREVDGGAITPTSVTALSGSITCAIASNRALCPIPTEYTGAVDVSVVTTGYETSSFLSADRNVTANNIPFQLKVVVKDNQGTAILISSLTTITYNGVAPTYSTGNTAYWAVAAANKSLVIAKTGYVSAQLANPGLTNVSTSSTGGQTVITLGENDILETAVADGDSVAARGLYTALPGDITVEVSAEAGAATVLDAANVTIVCTGGSATALTGSPTMTAGSVGPVAPQAGSSCNNGDAGTITIAKDGFVTATQAFTYDSTARPNTVTLSSPMKFAQKITITREGDSAAVTPSSVTAGSSNTVCTISSNIAYCPVPVAQDGTANDITVTATGYETDTTTSTGNRVAATTAQQTISLSALKFQLKVIVTDSAGSAINVSDLSAITYNTAQAPTYSTANTAYWAVVATNAPLVITKTNYVAAASTNTGLNQVSTGPTVGQTVITFNTGGVRSTAVANGDTITARGLVTASAGDLLVTAGPEAGPASVLDGAAITLFCTGGTANTLTGDGTLNGGSLGPAAVKAGSSCDNGDTGTVTISKDGFVTKTTTFTFSTTARPNTAAIGNTVLFAQKITITREGDSAAVTPSSVTAGSSNTVCTISSNIAYCPVPVAQDGTANDITVTATGYATGRASTGNRATGTSAQLSVTATNLRFTTKLVIAREAGAAITSLSDITIQRSVSGGELGVVTPTVVSAGTAYVADDPAAGSVSYKILKTGYVTTTVSTYTPSAAGQRVSTVSLPYTVKVRINLLTGEQVIDLRGLVYYKFSRGTRSTVTPTATSTFAFFAEDPSQGGYLLNVGPTRSSSVATAVNANTSTVTPSASAQQLLIASLPMRVYRACEGDFICVDRDAPAVNDPPSPVIVPRDTTPLTLDPNKAAEQQILPVTRVRTPTPLKSPVGGGAAPAASPRLGSAEHFEATVLVNDLASLRRGVVSKVQPGRSQPAYVLSEQLVRNFVKEGTESTKKLSTAERQSVVEHYTRVCGHAPRVNYGTDWEDVMRLSNGYLPSPLCKVNMTIPLKQFQSVYARKANLKVAADKRAIEIMTFGFFAKTRSLAAEVQAVKRFIKVFKRQPKLSTEWSVVRAIAYSQAK